MTTPPDGRGPAVLRVAVRREPPGVRLLLSGELDVATTPQLVSSVSDVMGDGALRDGDQVCLDLSGLSFVDVAGLTALVRARALADARRTSLVLTGARPLTRRLLQITGLVDAFAVGAASAQPST